MGRSASGERSISADARTCASAPNYSLGQRDIGAAEEQRPEQQRRANQGHHSRPPRIRRIERFPSRLSENVGSGKGGIGRVMAGDHAAVPLPQVHCPSDYRIMVLARPLRWSPATRVEPCLFRVETIRARLVGLGTRARASTRVDAQSKPVRRVAFRSSQLACDELPAGIGKDGSKRSSVTITTG